MCGGLYLGSWFKTGTDEFTAKDQEISTGYRELTQKTRFRYG